MNQDQDINMNMALFYDIQELLGDDDADLFESAITACQLRGVRTRPHSDRISTSFPLHMVVPESVHETAPPNSTNKDLGVLAAAFWADMQSRLNAARLNKLDQESEQVTGEVIKL